MRKSEFMDLLKYYFRKADKDDLKGIIEDCEEQFRLGAKEGKSEEEICVKLGSPKNIYRYYMGKPIVPEDNPRLPNDDFDARRRPKREPYDWEKDEDLLRRRQQSQQYYRTEAPAAPAERDSTRHAAVPAVPETTKATPLPGPITTVWLKQAVRSYALSLACWEHSLRCSAASSMPSCSWPLWQASLCSLCQRISFLVSFPFPLYP